ncbi:beta-1,3-galactosyltransferase 5-like [Penaeus chinensis]|uniref:beta-1,3-galactosyltransferase 5-like n=1 Tax=Penaeus chinensis TaxID=139456 RepID=UPI001FB7FF93|nr:beta-1,3-galactosyltransferase 5-like [Penaeus chinensis]XP_047480081.1 beta-1,3-galactosyltransferase 5-like [Penaeus chinensis]XP_047480082.1 beta-1,3-galactosyltransferase 5-like [Penaeus chinensis]XP_047480083.1 beta-1,3-galactosyltransferase 5-like [Penaeus chinensis]
MRWCRRSSLIILLGLLVAGLVLIWGKPFWPNFSPRGTTTTQPNITLFFANIHQLWVEPAEVLKTCQDKKVDVLVIVPTSAANHEAREAVRKSWNGNFPANWPVMFYLGATNNPQLQKKIAEEGRQYGDIAQDLSFFDSYNNLTLKTLSLVSWAQKFCRKANYVLKIDDDVFLNTKKFHDFITCVTNARNDIYKKLYQKNTVTLGEDVLQDKFEEESMQPSSSTELSTCESFKPYGLINYFLNSKSHDYESYIFGGYLYKNVQADRNPSSKWYLDRSVYRYDRLPPFLSGTAYIMSSNIIPHLIHEAKQHPVIALEDVYMSGIIGSQGLKLKLSHLDGWSRFRPRWDSVCTYNELLTAHGLSPAELSSMSLAVASLDNGACDGILTHILNNFNSLISYLFPRVSK